MTLKQLNLVSYIITHQSWVGGDTAFNRNHSSTLWCVSEFIKQVKGKLHSNWDEMEHKHKHILLIGFSQGDYCYVSASQPIWDKFQANLRHHSSISQVYHLHILRISKANLRHFSVIAQAYLRKISSTSWEDLSQISRISPDAYPKYITRISKVHIRHISGLSQTNFMYI